MPHSSSKRRVETRLNVEQTLLSGRLKPWSCLGWIFSRSSALQWSAQALTSDPWMRLKIWSSAWWREWRQWSLITLATSKTHTHTHADTGGTLLVCLGLCTGKGSTGKDFPIRHHKRSEKIGPWTQASFRTCLSWIGTNNTVIMHAA